MEGVPSQKCPQYGYTAYLALVWQEQRLGMNGPSGLLVKVLSQHARDMGLSPIWFQFFSVTQAL